MSNQIESQLTYKEIDEIFESTKDYVHSFKNMLDKQDKLNDLIVKKKERYYDCISDKRKIIFKNDIKRFNLY